MLRYMYTSIGVFFNRKLMINFKNIAVIVSKSPITGPIFAGIMVAICLLGVIMPRVINADFANTTNASYVIKNANEAEKAVKTIKVVITAYSSTPDQTDDTPFETASGRSVRDGVIANNMLPFGTKVTIPSLYGDKIFTVEDRMNRRKSDYHFDIWMPDRALALNFGVKTAEIQVLEN